MACPEMSGSIRRDDQSRHRRRRCRRERHAGPEEPAAGDGGSQGGPDVGRLYLVRRRLGSRNVGAVPVPLVGKGGIAGGPGAGVGVEEVPDGGLAADGRGASGNFPVGLEVECCGAVEHTASAGFGDAGPGVLHGRRFESCFNVVRRGQVPQPGHQEGGESRRMRGGHGGSFGVRIGFGSGPLRSPVERHHDSVCGVLGHVPSRCGHVNRGAVVGVGRQQAGARNGGH